MLPCLLVVMVNHLLSVGGTWRNFLRLLKGKVGEGGREEEKHLFMGIVLQATVASRVESFFRPGMDRHAAKRGLSAYSDTLGISQHSHSKQVSLYPMISSTV